MGITRRNTTYGSDRRGGRVKIYHGVGTAPKTFKDEHVGKAGYTPCRTCGRWVRIRVDGTLFNHVTLSVARIPCIGGGSMPAATDETSDA